MPSETPLRPLGRDPIIDPVRSRIMRSVGRKHTAPEMTVRRALHALGYRFRIQRRDLPGSPDIVLPKYKTVIFVHGCFWHRHSGCKKATTPKTRVEFWAEKFERNVARDRLNEMALRTMGWQVLVIWECETYDLLDQFRLDQFSLDLKAFLTSDFSISSERFSANRPSH